MAILIDRTRRVLVQGITGREGMTRTQLMRAYGTQVVAGVTPGKGGQTVESVPVFDTVSEAWEHVGPIDVSVLFIPAPLVKSAALEAIDAGVRLLVIVPDRVPTYDVLEIVEAAQRTGAQFVGPNTLGVLSPDQGVLGMMGGQAASAREWFFPGPVGVTSRSGGITTSIAYYLARAGIGTSTLVHVGGDPVVGMPHPSVMRQFERDPQTRAIVMFGEIGTSQEEQVADLIAAGEITKPVIAYIGGRNARRGTRFSHAGAIIEGERGTYEGKVARLREAGAIIVDSFADIPAVTRHVLDQIESKQHRGAQSAAQNAVKRGDSDLHWTTAITEVKPNELCLRGYRLDTLMGQVTFAQAIYLALAGSLPTPEVGRLLDAMLVASIDHGATPPSALAARTSASTGAPLNAALAAGILSINRHHGGAIEDCMRVIQDVSARAEQGTGDVSRAARDLVAEYRASKARLPGFGHRIHTHDPRTVRLFELAGEANVSSSGVQIVQALANSLHEQSGRALPINVDGAMAAVLFDLGIAPELANAFFIMARVPGLVAHIHEEQTRERPMRRIHPVDHSYDGPPCVENE